eukprot:8193010-Alexandrium_andersonii.AAC.1
MTRGPVRGHRRVMVRGLGGPQCTEKQAYSTRGRWGNTLSAHQWRRKYNYTRKALQDVRKDLA